MEKQMDKIYTKEELISKLAEMKNGGITYSPQKFGAKYWRSLKGIDINLTRKIYSKLAECLIITQLSLIKELPLERNI